MSKSKTVKKKTTKTRSRSTATGRFSRKSTAVKTAMNSYVVSGTTVHVVPRQDGWAVKSEGTSRAAKVYKGKSAAVSRGKEIASKRSGHVVIHKKDGSFDKRIKPTTAKKTTKRK